MKKIKRYNNKIKEVWDYMEYIDEIDENNIYTGKSFPKSDFHKFGKWYREVIGFVLNENGEILLQQRSKNKEAKPLYWEVCTGHVSKGEQPEEAMIRELKEEIDLDVNAEDLIKIKVMKTKEKIKEMFHYAFSYIYLIKTNKKINEFTMQKEEVCKIKYIKIEELKEMIEKREEKLCLLAYKDILDILDKISSLSKIKVREVNIDEAIEVHKNVLEFKETKPEKEYFENRYKDSDKLIIVAYYDNKPAGYIIGYDKFKDNKDSFYCWMAGTHYKYRRKGILSELMRYQMNWARKNGYKVLRIKTRNNRREMLNFLVKTGFNFVSVEERENIEDNRINLEIRL